MFSLFLSHSKTVTVSRAIEKCSILQILQIKSKFDLVVGGRLLFLLIEVNGVFILFIPCINVCEKQVLSDGGGGGVEVKSTRG